jgi:hypothetical protein
LDALAVECRNIAFEITKKYPRFDRSRREDIAHEATSRLIERYLKKPGYHVRSFASMLRTEIRHVVTNGGHNNRPSAEIERTMGCIDDSIIADEREQQEDRRYFVEDIRSEHLEGERILLDLFRATTFRAAVLQLSTYVDKRWLYDRSVKLRTVYRMTRRRKV